MYGAGSKLLRLGECSESYKEEIVQKLLKSLHEYSILSHILSKDEQFKLALNLIGLTPDMPFVEVGNYDENGNFALM